MSNDALIEIRQSFLSAGIQVTEKDLAQLWNYQNRLCAKLEWVEVDHTKLQRIISLFLLSRFVHSGNYMSILRKMLFAYYNIRCKFDYHTSDSEIYTLLHQEFERCAGLNLNQLRERVATIIRKEGGQYRVEQRSPIYR